MPTQLFVGTVGALGEEDDRARVGHVPLQCSDVGRIYRPRISAIARIATAATTTAGSSHDQRIVR